MAISRPKSPYPDQSWSGWGDPDLVPVLPEAIHALLRDALGVRSSGRQAITIDQLSLPAPRLSPELRQRLSAIVGAEHLREDAESRVRHTRGKSTPDLLRLRSGDASDAPDAVVLPGSHEEILELLELCSAHRIAATPFGGGTSVVGGLAPEASEFASSLALDLRRLNAL